MRNNKTQQGNQLDCHRGPFNMNRGPNEASKVPVKPSKLQMHRDAKFFQPAKAPVELGLPSKEDQLLNFLGIASYAVTEFSGPK